MGNAATIGNVIDVYKYSSREKSLRETVWVQRFAHNCIVNVWETARITGNLSVEESFSSKKLWLQTVQSGLKGRATFIQLVSQLGLVESEGVLYCKGRLGASDLPLEARHQILLDNKHHYTNLLIEQCNQNVHHSGVRATLGTLDLCIGFQRGDRQLKESSASAQSTRSWKARRSVLHQVYIFPVLESKKQLRFQQQE